MYMAHTHIHTCKLFILHDSDSFFFFFGLSIPFSWLGAPTTLQNQSPKPSPEFCNHTPTTAPRSALRCTSIERWSAPSERFAAETATPAFQVTGGFWFDERSDLSPSLSLTTDCYVLCFCLSVSAGEYEYVCVLLSSCCGSLSLSLSFCSFSLRELRRKEPGPCLFLINYYYCCLVYHTSYHRRLFFLSALRTAVYMYVCFILNGYEYYSVHQYSYYFLCSGCRGYVCTLSLL